MNRKIILGLALALGASPALAQDFGSPELIAAANKEGKLVYYTANFAEVEQQVINAFNKRFPNIKVEMVRAPGGQLITRVKTEAAAGKLSADVVDHSDRALMSDLVDLFQDYAPPNAADYIPEAQISPKLWPRATLVWSIAYNTELVKNPPKTWMDLTKPEYGNKQIGQVFAASGGTTWTRIMFERQVLGEDYWKKQAATNPVLYPSGAPTADALVRGEVSIAPLLAQRHLSEAEGRRADQDFLSARRRAGQSLRHRHPENRRASERRKTVPELESVAGRPDLHDQGARQSHLAESGAGVSGRVRSEGGEAVAAEIRRIRKICIQRLGGRVEQDLQLSAVSDGSHQSHTAVILRSRALARRLEGWPRARVAHPSRLAASGEHLRMTAVIEMTRL